MNNYGENYATGNFINLAIQLISNYPDQDDNGPHHRFQNQLLYYNQKQIIKDILQEQKNKNQVQENEHQESLKHYNKILRNYGP